VDSRPDLLADGVLVSSHDLLRSVGELIRSASATAGLTQRELGERAGIVGKYVSEIERGTRDLPVSTLFAIAEGGLQRRLEISFRDRMAPNEV
jgi:transcriptional regulator with XRE-family HTH domain